MMEFWRDSYSGPGCIEYSWVPEGHRNDIELAPGQIEGVGGGPGIPATLVQVYVANNVDGPTAVSVQEWQFPSHFSPPPNNYLYRARVEIFQRQNKIVGTAWYVDPNTHIPTKVVEIATLDAIARRCPTGLGSRAAKGEALGGKTP
jgi:hypothetical protein